MVHHETSCFSGFPWRFFSSLHDFGAVCAITRWCLVVCVYACFFSLLPHYKLFETQAQLIVVTEEFGIRWDLIQKDLRHLQWALHKKGGKGRGEEGDKNKDAVLDWQRNKNGAEEGKTWLIQTGEKSVDKSWLLSQNTTKIWNQRRSRDPPPEWPMSLNTLHIPTIWLPFVHDVILFP